MSSHQQSTASTPTSSFQELKSATFSVDLTSRGASLQADPDDVQKVFDHLHNVTYTTLFGDRESTEEVPQLPPRGFKTESKSYKPLTHLLNIIVGAANICLDRLSYLKGQNLHLYPHGIEMEDKLEEPLKPGISGLLQSCASNESKVSWNDAAVIVEVKAQQIKVVNKLATYARCTPLT
ncbi:hypothetical protein H4582DRAFT_1911556 [Lactarius indigo]|nr:hypothetical protein H4582DRAFT_1911556 [Lactarius indigo]